MESGAKGCEVVVSGKLRGQRAKSMKFTDGLMIHSGEPLNDYVDTAVRHVLLRQGMFSSACTHTLLLAARALISVQRNPPLPPPLFFRHFKKYCKSEGGNLYGNTKM